MACTACCAVGRALPLVAQIAKALGNSLTKRRRRAAVELFRGSNMGEGSFALRCVGRQASPCIMIADQKPACALCSGACLRACRGPRRPRSQMHACFQDVEAYGPTSGDER